ncbi:MAG: hypothetical protein Q9209_004786 [Squamulea sp. 1 TL-2023]
MPQLLNPELQIHQREDASLRKASAQQAGPEHVSIAREYLSTMQALDGSEDSETILKKASLICLNERRRSRDLPPLTNLELNKHLDRIVIQISDSLRNVHSATGPEDIMEKLNDELIGVTPAEREQFLVLESVKVLERKGELQAWPQWVLEALEIGDLRSDFWGTEVRRGRKDLIEYLMCESGDKDSKASVKPQLVRGNEG